MISTRRKLPRNVQAVVNAKKPDLAVSFARLKLIKVKFRDIKKWLAHGFLTQACHLQLSRG